MSFVLEVGLCFPLFFSFASGSFPPAFPAPRLHNSSVILSELNGFHRCRGQNSMIQGLAGRKEGRRATFLPVVTSY